MNRLAKFSFASIFLMYLTSAGAIKCYDCNSANNTMCIDPKMYDEETRQRFLPVMECKYGLQAPMNEQFFCRKIVQTVFHKDREDVRVNRGCGWIRDDRDCYKADNEDHLETVCQCFHDGCNSARKNTLAIFGLIAVLASFVML